MLFNLTKETKRKSFATRESAAALRAEIASILNALPPGQTLEIDLAGVEALTVSFADELVAKLAVERRVLGMSDTFFLISSGIPEVAETIEVALERRGLFAAYRSEQGFTLLGGPTHLQETFITALELREFTAGELADHMGLKLPAANNRIRQLAEAGVVIRKLHAPAAGGRQYRYSAAA